MPRVAVGKKVQRWCLTGDMSGYFCELYSIRHLSHIPCTNSPLGERDWQYQLRTPACTVSESLLRPTTDVICPTVERSCTAKIGSWKLLPNHCRMQPSLECFPTRKEQQMNAITLAECSYCPWHKAPRLWLPFRVGSAMPEPSRSAFKGPGRRQK